MSNIPIDLPTYIKEEDFANQQTYFEYQSLILSLWFNSSGFFNPSLTDAQVTALLALANPPPTGTRWFNVTQNKEQFIDSGGVVQTITSA